MCRTAVVFPTRPGANFSSLFTISIVNDVVEEKKPVKAEIDEAIIQKAIEEALTKNEMMRQKRKAEKKAKADEALRVAKAQEEIRKAVYPAKLYMGDQGFASKHIFNFQ